MLELKHRKWVALFGGVALLVLAQLGWWVTVLLDDVRLVSDLKNENLSLKMESSVFEYPQELEKIKNDAFHRRVMIWSESSFFILLTCFGFYLLYRALKVESRAREIEKNFIEVVSHESKTPITAMKLRLESMTERCEDKSLNQELRQALEEVRRLSSIYDKAMGLNRLERRALSLELVSVSELVREVLKRLDPLFKARTVNVSMDIDSDMVVRADLFSMQNTLQNVLENAVLYNPKPDKKIDLSATRKDSQVIISIADNGPGIDPEDCVHVFEKFYRGKNQKHKARAPGTGLGLYITARVIEAHQGTIDLLQSDLGGVRFEISLPSVEV